MDTNQLFEEVYREKAILIYHYLCSIDCPPQDAEDMIQETFVKALINIDSFRGDSKLSVWLCQIAKNTWYSHLKKQKHQVSHLTSEQIPSDNFGLEWIDFVQLLAEPYRSIFIQKVLEGWSYKELAQRYGKTESWARVTFHRARLRLQKMLDE